MTILIYLLVISLLSFGLISASRYVDEVGRILNTIWDFAMNNMFGFLILIVVVIAVVALIKRLSDPRSRRGEDYAKYQEGKINKYLAKKEKSKYKLDKIDKDIDVYASKKRRINAKADFKSFKKKNKKGGASE